MFINQKIDLFIFNNQYEIIPTLENNDLAKSLRLATFKDGEVANIVQIIENLNCIYHDRPYTPLSEEIVGIDKQGIYTSPGELVFLTIHGLGVLTPRVRKAAEIIGYIGNRSADLDKFFPNQEVLSTILQQGLLPDGRQIDILSYSDYKESGVPDSRLLHGVVRNREQATYPDFNEISNLTDNPQIITYCGGKKRMSNLFKAWEKKGQGKFHTRNILFDSKKIFLDTEQTQLIGTLANPLYGPCDGFYGNWTLTNQGNNHLLIKY